MAPFFSALVDGTFLLFLETRLYRLRDDRCNERQQIEIVTQHGLTGTRLLDAEALDAMIVASCGIQVAHTRPCHPSEPAKLVRRTLCATLLSYTPQTFMYQYVTTALSHDAQVGGRSRQHSCLSGHRSGSLCKRHDSADACCNRGISSSKRISFAGRRRMAQGLRWVSLAYLTRYEPVTALSDYGIAEQM